MLPKKYLMWIIGEIFFIIFLFSCANEQDSKISVDPEVYQTLENKEFVRVIIHLKKPKILPADLEEEKLLISNAQKKLLSLLPKKHFRPLRIYKNLWAVSGYIDQQGISILEKSNKVKRIEYVTELKKHLDVSTILIDSKIVNNDFGYTGEGIGVCVIDTGIDASHPAFSGRIVYQHCFCEDVIDDQIIGCCPNWLDEDDSAQDDDGHGTHVTGIIAAEGIVQDPFGDLVQGVAPKAKIIAIKVMDKDGHGKIDDVASAIDLCIDLSIEKKDEYNIRIINLSLGEYVEASEECDDGSKLSDAIKRAHNNNLVIFASSGNDAIKDPNANLNRPACLEQVISVGSVYKINYLSLSWGEDCPWWNPLCNDTTCTDSSPDIDVVGCFSNSTNQLDILAPGAIIYSTVIRGEGDKMDSLKCSMNQYIDSKDYDCAGGTSQAAPHASGVAALMLEANPYLTPDDIAKILKNTGPEVTDPKSGITRHRIDAYEAVQNALPPRLQDYYVSPVSGDQYTTFEFVVTYYHKMNLEPDYVKVYIDGKEYELASSDTTYDDGAQFTLTKSNFSPGMHTFYFETKTGVLPHIVKTETLSFMISSDRQLCVSPDVLSFGFLPRDSKSSLYLYIGNCGYGNLQWSLYENLDWLSANYTSGIVPEGQTNRVMITVDTAGLSPGNYSGNIIIASPYDSVTIPVSLMVVSSHSIILTPTKDGYISMEYPDQNYGSSDKIKASAHCIYQSGRETQNIGLMDFNISQLPPNISILSAKLHIYITHIPSNDKLSIRYPDDYWDEYSVTWNNAPPIYNNNCSAKGVRKYISSTGWTEVDITPYVNQTYLWNHLCPGYGISFVGYDCNSFIFNSKEASSNQPYLEIKYSEIPPTFILSFEPYVLKLKNPGDSGEITVSAQAQGGFSSSIALAIYGLPSGANASFNPASIEPGNSSTLIITTSPSIPEGLYPITVEGKSGDMTRQFIFLLQIGNALKPTLYITSIEDNLDEPSGLIKINYVADDPNNSQIKTCCWQYSIDGSNWIDIDESEIMNNDFKESGPSYILWDSYATLKGKKYEQLWFRMKVDNGIPYMSALKYYDLTEDLADITDVSWDSVNNFFWVTDDDWEELVKYDPNFNLLQRYSSPFGDQGEPTDVLVISDRLYLLDEDCDDGGLITNGCYTEHNKYNMPPLELEYWEPFDGDHHSPQGFTYDGNYLWIVVRGYILKSTLRSDDFVEAFPTPLHPEGIEWDGANLWICDDKKIAKLDESLNIIEEYDCPRGFCTGLAWDGFYFYVSIDDSGRSFVAKLNPFRQYSDYATSPAFYVDADLPPNISNLPNIDIDEDSSLSSVIDLWNYVDDPESSPDTLTYTISYNSNPNDCLVSISQNRYIDVILTNNNTLPCEVEVEVDDGYKTDTGTFFIYINPINDPPSITLNDALTFDEDTEFSLDLDNYVIDVDNNADELTWTFSGNNNLNINIDPNSHLLTIIPKSNWYGSEILTFTVTDPGGLSDTKNVVVKVNSINDPPVIISSPNLIAIEGTSYNYDVDASDVDGDTLTYSLIKAPQGMTIDSSSGLINWIPSYKDAYVEVQVTDGKGGIDTQSFKIKVDFIDTDMDHMPDTWEMENFSSLEQSSTADYDNDLLTNLQEFYNQTNPTINNWTMEDSDGDGMPDDYELAMGLQANTVDASADLDNDGFTNLIEYLNGTPPDLDNKNLEDYDGDQIPDQWEWAVGLDSKRNDVTEDQDNDGFTNFIEYLNATNPLWNNQDIYQDSDNDLIPDLWEIAYNLDPKVSNSGNDNDADGIADLIEYFNGTNPQILNTTLQDIDQDGMPDQWEIAYGISPDTDDSELDLDDDGISNWAEYKNGSDPFMDNSSYSDIDADGLPDYWEIAWNIEESNEDFDNDGLVNIAEYMNGLNPLLPDPSPYEIIISPTQAILQVGEQQQFTAEGDIPPSTWAVSDSSIGTINSDGLFTAKNIGNCTIILTDSKYIKGTASITVTNIEKEKDGGGGNEGCGCMITSINSGNIWVSIFLYIIPLLFLLIIKLKRNFYC